MRFWLREVLVKAVLILSLIGTIVAALPLRLGVEPWTTLGLALLLIPPIIMAIGAMVKVGKLKYASYGVFAPVMLSDTIWALKSYRTLLFNGIMLIVWISSMITLALGAFLMFKEKAE